MSALLSASGESVRVVIARDAVVLELPGEPQRVYETKHRAEWSFYVTENGRLVYGNTINRNLYAPDTTIWSATLSGHVVINDAAPTTPPVTPPGSPIGTPSMPDAMASFNLAGLMPIALLLLLTKHN